MAAHGLADAVAELSGLADSSPDKCLKRLVELAAQSLRGCAGATSTVWRFGQVQSSAASHPDLAVLLDRQLATGCGPVLDAVRTGTAVSCADTLAEGQGGGGAPRWPEFAAEALRLGVRCSATLVHSLDGQLVTLTLYGTKPQALDPAAVPAASLLAAVTGAALASSARLGDSRRTAWQLQEAVTARAVVDQAKGLMMDALGCDADQALDRLRQLSQTRHMKVTEIAQAIIEEHSRGKRSRRPRQATATAAGQPSSGKAPVSR